MYDSKKISGSQNETKKEAEDRVLKPWDRGSAVRKSRRRGGREARR